MYTQSLAFGNFVRVKPDSDFRPGQDGMVIDAGDGVDLGLMFAYDRYNRSPSDLGITRTGLTEAWNIQELDLIDIAR